MREMSEKAGHTPPQKNKKNKKDVLIWWRCTAPQLPRKKEQEKIGKISQLTDRMLPNMLHEHSTPSFPVHR